MNSQEQAALINEEITRLEKKRKIYSLVSFFEDIQKILQLTKKDTICLAGCVDKSQGLFIIVDSAKPETQYPLFRKFLDHHIDADKHNHDEIQDTLKTNNLVITKNMTSTEFMNKYAQNKYAKIYLKDFLTETLIAKPSIKALKI